MIVSTASAITAYFVDKAVIEPEDRDVFQYGVEYALSTVIGLTCVFTLAILLHKVVYAFLFLGILYFLKSFTGGYHASSYLSCKICTVSIFLLGVILFDCTGTLHPLVWFFIMACSFCLIARYAPCEHVNKPLNESQRKHSRKMSILTAFVICLAIVLLYWGGADIYRYVTLLLATVASNLMVGVKVKERET